MPTVEEKKAIVETILHSREFKDSPVYTNLLSYLVESYFANTIPKEITIAIDVFGKDASYNSNKDSAVRYHIHMLRKKLYAYYKNEGKSDKIRLVIPTGHYEIEFTSSKTQTLNKSDHLVTFIMRWEIVIIVLLLAVVSYLVYLQSKSGRASSILSTSSRVDPTDEFWSPFFENQYPVTLILGDDFLLDEYQPEYKRYRQIRDWQINSENDLSTFLIQFPKANLWKSEITDIPFNGTTNLMDILPIVYRFQPDVSLTMSSTLSLEGIRKRDIIYIGELKNLRVLNKIINKTPVRFQYHPDERLFILGDNGDTLHTFLRIEAPYDAKNKYNIDYSLLIKMPGFEKENLMFIVGFGYGGRLERTKMLANSALRKNFIEDVKKMNKTMPPYFIALFEVKSIERTGFTNELKYFKEISPDFFTQ